MGVKPADVLREQLRRIDGRGYKAYKDIAGSYDFKKFALYIDHVQGDPYAAPSRLRARVRRTDSGFAKDTTANKSRTIALGDFLTRRFSQQSRRLSKGS
ncbi:MAG: hypothetical protein KFF46_03870, partial [Desulfobacterales bacterium]|nr:hypothetical protein [Desulfobacterales bacterium]